MITTVKNWLKIGWESLKTKRRLGLFSFALLALVFATIIFFTVPTARAQGLADVNFITDWMARATFMVSRLFLSLSLFLLTFIIQLAGYNGFIDSTTVNIGWVMMRDLVNMLFVIFLLIIAFGTILGLEQYEWKKLMVKFVLAAILVNFSRVICGVMIDVAQVVMITFVNGIAATAGGNLINAFSLDTLYNFTPQLSPEKLDTLEVMISSAAAVVFTGMLMVTMLSIMVMLLFRVVVLWVLIVLSPMAFVLNVIPKTEHYASEWWKEFGNHVVAGPVLLFFVWLAFITLGNGNIDQEIAGASVPAGNFSTTDAGGVAGGAAATSGISAVMGWEKMANFAIAIAMLLAGAKISQQFSVQGGDMVSKAKDFGKKVGTIALGVGAGMWAYDTLKGGAGKAGHWGRQKGIDVLADYGSMIHSGTNIAWNRVGSRVPILGKAINWSARRAKKARALKEASELSDKLLSKEQSGGMAGDLKRLMAGQVAAYEERSKYRDEQGVAEAKLAQLKRPRRKDGKDLKPLYQEVAHYKTEAADEEHLAHALITGQEAKLHEEGAAEAKKKAEDREKKLTEVQSDEVKDLNLKITANTEQQEAKANELLSVPRAKLEAATNKHADEDKAATARIEELDTEEKRLINKYTSEASQGKKTFGAIWYGRDVVLQKEKNDLENEYTKQKDEVKKAALKKQIDDKKEAIRVNDAEWMPQELSEARSNLETKIKERTKKASDFNVFTAQQNDAMAAILAGDNNYKVLQQEGETLKKQRVVAVERQKETPEYKKAAAEAELITAYTSQNHEAEHNRKDLEKKLEADGLKKKIEKEVRKANPDMASEQVDLEVSRLFKAEVDQELGEEFLVDYFASHPELIAQELGREKLEKMVDEQMRRTDTIPGVEADVAATMAPEQKKEAWRRHLIGTNQVPTVTLAEQAKRREQKANELAEQFTRDGYSPGFTTLGARAARAEVAAEAADARLKAAKAGAREEALALPETRAAFEAAQRAATAAEGAEKAIDAVKQGMLQQIFEGGLKDLKAQDAANREKARIELARQKEAAKGANADQNLLRKLDQDLQEQTRILKKPSAGAKLAKASVAQGYVQEYAGISRQEALDEADDHYSMEHYGHHTQSTAMKSLIKKKMEEYTGMEREQAVVQAVDSFSHMQAILAGEGKLGKDQEAMMMASITFLTKNGWSDDMLAEIVSRVKQANRGALSGREREQGELLKKLFAERLNWGSIDDNNQNLNNLVNQSSNRRTNDLHRLIGLGGDANLMMSENAVLKHMKDTGKSYSEAFKSLATAVAGGVDNAAKNLGFSEGRLKSQLQAFADSFKLKEGYDSESAWQDYKNRIESHAESYQVLADAKSMALANAHLDDGGHTYYDMKDKMFRGQDADDAMRFILSDWRKIGSDERMRRLKTHTNGQMNEESGTIAIDIRNAQALRETYQNVNTVHNFNRQDGRNIDHLAGLAAGEKAIIDKLTGAMIVCGENSAMQTKTFGHLGGGEMIDVDGIEKQMTGEQRRMLASIRQFADNCAIAIDNAPLALAASLGARSNVDFDEATTGKFNIMLPEGASLSDGSREIKTLDHMLEFIDRYRSDISREQLKALNKAAIHQAFDAQARSQGSNRRNYEGTPVAA